MFGGDQLEALFLLGPAIRLQRRCDLDDPGAHRHCGLLSRTILLALHTVTSAERKPAASSSTDKTVDLGSFGPVEPSEDQMLFDQEPLPSAHPFRKTLPPTEAAFARIATAHSSGLDFSEVGVPRIAGEWVVELRGFEPGCTLRRGHDQ